ncbi:hypothetical protein KFK09_005835 [Dendrobium nobile]|uniref:DUF4220 domain-containing protein n=1 Tax=Dendrobium nobile TaxID=94219 RepID=A0A8T3BWS7_DENNO|nr:hypothetical protein KFK09_005835 [Dendrobium nobile]
MDDSSSSNAIIAFWAPFLILHLGGPDTITAYSMEDNELWPRHLVGLIYDIIIALYVIVRSLPTTRLLAPTILMFLVAIIKYAERSYSLYKASTERFRSSIESSPRKPPINIYLAISNTVGLNDLNGAFGLYSVSKPLFVGLYPRAELYSAASHFFEDMTAKDILKVTGMEFSYAYDELYTKAAVNHSRVGYVLRTLCSICIMLTFSLFVLVPKDGFHKLDVAITYVLLMASIFLDTMSNIMLMFSNWMIVTLLNVKKLRNFSKLLAEHIFRIKRVWLKRKYWLGEMPQLNLINDCLKNSTLNKAPRRSLMGWIKEKLNSVQGTKSYLSDYNDYKAFTLHTLQPIIVTEELQDIITTYAQRRFLEYLKGSSEPTSLLALQEVTTALNWVDPSFLKHISELSFDQQVLVWHISTELCFHWKSDLHPLYSHQIEIEVEENKARSSEMEVCKYLSNYLMYMVLMRPETMSTMGGSSPLLFKRVCDDMVQLICRSVDNNHSLMQNATIEEVCREMLTTPIEWKDPSFYDIALVLAHMMLLINNEKRWQIMTMVWADLLIQGAKNTKAITHVKQLNKGGDFLTFIWFLTKHILMAEGLDIRIYKMENLIDKAEELFSKIKEHL